MELNKLLRSETSDIQLKELANRLCVRLEPIVFKDELHNLKIPTEKRLYNYLIHLRDPAHWVSLVIDNKNHKAYYFNSFSYEFGGIPFEIIDFVKRSNSILYESDIPIQDPNRGYCGPYAVLFLYYINRPSNDINDFNDYLKLFKSSIDQVNKYKEIHPELEH